MVDKEIKQIEEKWQKHWKENKTFQPKIDNSKEKFFATIAYPYANSVMHIGHGRTSTTADIIARYNRVLGKNVLYPMGFHITGTPVLAVADGIKKGDEKQIKLTRDAISDYLKNKKDQDELLETFKEPMNIANFFSSKIEETFDSVGLSIDWSRQFMTGDKQYQKFIEWQFRKLKELGILVQGKYPILYSVADKNAVGEDDIKDGDTDKVSVQEMNYIQFKLTNTDEYLVAATLRPDSIFGATNLYVKPDMDLVKLNVNGIIWIVSEASQVKVENQFEIVSFISKHKGSEFLEQEVTVPIINKKVPIYPMNYPDENHGTGIVYSSPADSPHDYIYLFELKFPNRSLEEFDKDPLQLTPITKTKNKKGEVINYKSDIPAFDKLLKSKIYNVKGNEKNLEIIKEELYKEAHFGAIMINCGEFDNTPLKGNLGSNKVREKLKELNLGGIFYETSRRAKTRSGDDVIVAVLDKQWFLDYTKDETKQKAYDVLDNMTYSPEKLKATQKGYLEWVQMRPCARRRGLGTQLPYDKEWVIEALSDSTIYQMLYTISNTIYGKKIPSENLTFEFFDYALLGNGDISKVSKETKIEKSLLEQMRKEVLYWKSFDLRYTASTHMSNHLSFLIYHYGLIFPKEMWPKNITIGGLLIKDGEKISKSKGNGIPLYRIKEIYGADLYRLYVSVAANYDIELDFRDDEINQLEKKLNRWKYLVEEAIKIKPKKYEEFNDTEKWFISKFYSRVEDYFKFMNLTRIREAYVSILYEFLNDISYFERRTSEEDLIKVFSFILKDYLKLMTPVIPHICEEYNSQIGNKTEISLQAYTTDSSKYISELNEGIEKVGQDLLAQVSKTKEVKNLTKIKKITLVQASKDRFNLFTDLKKMLDKKENFKLIMQELNKRYNHETKFISKFVPKTLGSGLSYYLDQKEELEYLKEFSKFLEKEFECIVEITNNDNLDEKVQNAIPGEVGIILE